ncbi:hypothetical protein [uncultured Sphingomonas sp.]|uniref:hypothetical protein n=1 Tax=uncultured Sphingomonas sp. TaxID=158754 RepID=UPI0025CCDA9F|nr:hypothetical protein [uncultured Sphingomonas sp.]
MTARTLRSAFASYRANIEVARDPDERRVVRDAAWSRAAKARARLERVITALEAGAAS